MQPGAAGILVRRALQIVVVLAPTLGWLRVTIESAGLVDTAFGTALRTLVEIVLLTALVWWAVRRIGAHERAQIESEAEVRRQAGQLAAFLETAAIGLHRADADGTILWANDAELRMLGYAREEYVGHHLSEFHADPRDAADLLARLRRGEKLAAYRTRMRSRDGTVRTVLVDSSVLWDDDGKFVHTQCFTRDVTSFRPWSSRRVRPGCPSSSAASTGCRRGARPSRAPHRAPGRARRPTRAVQRVLRAPDGVLAGGASAAD